jgi:hypothetical protein
MVAVAAAQLPRTCSRVGGLPWTGISMV